MRKMEMKSRLNNVEDEQCPRRCRNNRHQAVAGKKKGGGTKPSRGNAFAVEPLKVCKDHREELVEACGRRVAKGGNRGGTAG